MFYDKDILLALLVLEGELVVRIFCFSFSNGLHRGGSMREGTPHTLHVTTACYRDLFAGGYVIRNDNGMKPGVAALEAVEFLLFLV